jgi:endonuclease/exonuclease/phosphatase family metal-dependent hydrolase
MLNPRKRGAIRATLQTPCGIIHVFNTHLSLFKLERRKQLKALLGENWRSSGWGNLPVIFCGDLNAGALSETYRRLSGHLIDVQTASPDRLPPQPTFHAQSPVFRIDHIFVSNHFQPLKAEVKRSRDMLIASDHLPLVVDLRVKHPKSNQACTDSDQS